MKIQDYSKDKLTSLLSRPDISKGIFLFIYNNEPKKENILDDVVSTGSFSKAKFLHKTNYKTLYHIY